MEIVNFGIVKAIVSNKFTNTLVEGESKISEKKNINEFVAALKKSPLLEAEFNIYTKIENKTIKNENLAIKYIDSCLGQITEWNQSDLVKEHKTIEKFYDKNVSVDSDKTELYENIHSLIVNSIGKATDVDALHESFSFILDYVMKDKIETIVESKLPVGDIDESVISLTIQKFNSKFSTLSESEQKLLNTLFFSDDNKKAELFESLRQTGLEKLTSYKSKNLYSVEVEKSIEKVKNMSFNKTTLTEDVMKLNSLNRL